MTPPADGTALLAAFVAISLRGAFPPVDFLAVCLVRAIVDGGGNDGGGNTALPLVFLHTVMPLLMVFIGLESPARATVNFVLLLFMFSMFGFLY